MSVFDVARCAVKVEPRTCHVILLDSVKENCFYSFAAIAGAKCLWLLTSIGNPILQYSSTAIYCHLYLQGAGIHEKIALVCVSKCDPTALSVNLFILGFGKSIAGSNPAASRVRVTISGMRSTGLRTKILRWKSHALSPVDTGRTAVRILPSSSHCCP